MPRIVAALGLVMVLAALLPGSRGLGEDAPSVRLTFPVPQELLFASAAVLALAGIVILAAARGRRKLEEDPDEEEPPLQQSWWGRLLAQLSVMLPLLAILALLWLDGGRVAAALIAFGRRLFPDGDLPPAVADSTPVVALPWLGWGLGLMALLIALAMLGVALLLLFAERIAAWWINRHARDEVQPFTEAVDAGLDDLDAEHEPRVAIRKCYRRFEQAAEAARVPRASWQTPDEFLRDALTRLPVPGAAVRQLTRLFERARFSDHPVAAADREAARSCLEEIRGALEQAARDRDAREREAALPQGRPGRPDAGGRIGVA